MSCWAVGPKGNRIRWRNDRPGVGCYGSWATAGPGSKGFILNGIKFNWFFLLVAIVAIAVMASSSPRWGKWIFAIAVFAALGVASKKLEGALGVDSK